MKNQNNKNKILGGDEPFRRRRNGAKEFYFYYFGFSFVVYFLLVTASANAQFNLPNIGSVKPAITLNSDPLTPFPNSTVIITASLSGLTGADGSNYTWFLNGIKQIEASGLNKNFLNLKTGDVGAVYRISVDVQTTSGELSDTINLTVSDLDLTWAADSEGPAAYHSKLMPTQNSIVVISALPSIYKPGTKNLISSDNLIYNWKIDGKFDSSKSGLSQNLYVLRVSNFFGNSYLTRLEVKTSDGAVFLSKDIVIPVLRPQIQIHFSDLKNNRPFGIALKSFTTGSINLNFIAQTYFFAIPVKSLKWRWFINNAEIGGENEKPWLAKLNLDNNFSGQFSAQIKVTAENPDNNLESSESKINLEITK